MKSSVLAADYVRKFRIFTADSTRSTLTFRNEVPDGPTSNSDLMLDDVRVEPSGKRTLTVNSGNLSDIEIGVSLPDINGFATGLTEFSRTYADFEAVQLLAPAEFYGNIFRKWQQNGVDISTSPVITVVMNADKTLTAVYEPSQPPTVANDSYVTQEITPRIVPAAHGLLANDTDDSPNPKLVAFLESPPSNGTLTLEKDGGFTY